MVVNLRTIVCANTVGFPADDVRYVYCALKEQKADNL